MSDSRNKHSPPLPELNRTRSLSPPAVKLERKKPDALNLSPQRNEPATPSPVLTPIGPGTDELDTIWEPSNTLTLSLSPEHDMTALSPQHLEQILEKLLDQKERLQEQLSVQGDQARYLQQDLSSCTRERDVLIAQLSQLTPELSNSQLEDLDGFRTCPESDLLGIEPRARKFWDKFLRLRGELEGQRDIVGERDGEVRDLLSERSNTRILLEHLERLVARHERSLRSTVVKRHTAQNGVASEVEVLKALKCLFDHHKTLDRVKDKLKTQVARNKDLEDQLTDSIAQRELNQLEKYQNYDGLSQLIEREREIEALKFELDENRLINESQNEQSTQELEEAREMYSLEKIRCEEANKKLKDLYSLLTSKERNINKLEKQVIKCEKDLAELTQEANRRCLELQRKLELIPLQMFEPNTELIEPVNQLLIESNNLLTEPNNLLLDPNNQLITERNTLRERLQEMEVQMSEQREELENKSSSERLMQLRLQQTVEKLSRVQRDKMDLEQLLHENVSIPNQKRGSRRIKKSNRQSIHNIITEINRMSDGNGDQLHPWSQKRLMDPPRHSERQRRNSPDLTPYSSRKSSPIDENKVSPTESETGVSGLGAPLRESHSSLSDIETATTISDTSHIIVDESLPGRTELDPGAPKLYMSRSRKKSLKRKSSIRRIVSSFKGTKSPGTKETPSSLGECEAPEGRLARLQASISLLERENTQFLLWSPEALQGWVEVELGLPESVGDAVRWQCKTVPMLLSMGERDYEQELGILQPLLRLKLMKAVQERVAHSKASTPCLFSPYRAVNHEWIASHWLPSLGLTQYSNNFRQCCVDGRVLEHLSKKELRTSLGMVESSHRNSLQYGIFALKSLNYDRNILEDKQRQSVTDRTDLPFWSNRQISLWLHSIGLGGYTGNIESSGLHGAVLYFDNSYDYHEIAITLQIPQNDSVARKLLKVSVSDLMSQQKSSNSDKKTKRKSFVLFRRKSDAVSPRMSPEPESQDTVTPMPSSPTRGLVPTLLGLHSCSEDEDDKTNPVKFYC
ncbi:hypothetical protein LOD99_9532 [Oopsacas minuta]|uniref:SAM domain-containing protein n=1 Tax=Oopsacas minuta TaxID=111878 RepID=A0AAV7JBL1_9METZ|nr:hypothetical protein LOD99_9532 [Oopsacas minuta]